MTRRTALKALGTLLVCLAGKNVMAEDKTQSNIITDNWWENTPQSYVFQEKGISSIIIEKKDGSKLVVPFSEIVEALEAK